MMQNLPCTKCGQNTVTLTYAENRIYEITCPCGYIYFIEEISEQLALKYYDKMQSDISEANKIFIKLSIYAKSISTGAILKIEQEGAEISILADKNKRENFILSLKDAFSKLVKTTVEDIEIISKSEYEKLDKENESE